MKILLKLITNYNENETDKKTYKYPNIVCEIMQINCSIVNNFLFSIDPNTENLYIVDMLLNIEKN